ncbi:hypothetical protein E8E13_009561 [Curvularia kusanoi]|uniref:Transmembrane protein n=1 Tax=Curvularia kusanoi TaxID=90978 RepID=A0A9P4WCM0_CURKU|nr:hypothetical protein E8E13_009561 [Curvularia kusanoi]
MQIIFAAITFAAAAAACGQHHPHSSEATTVSLIQYNATITALPAPPEATTALHTQSGATTTRSEATTAQHEATTVPLTQAEATHYRLPSTAITIMAICGGFAVMFISFMIMGRFSKAGATDDVKRIDRGIV